MIIFEYNQFFKGALFRACMAVIVTHLVQLTVQTTHVLYTMEPVYHVNLAGKEQFVQYVRFSLIYYYLKSVIQHFSTCLKYKNKVNAEFP